MFYLVLCARDEAAHTGGDGMFSVVLVEIYGLYDYRM